MTGVYVLFIVLNFNDVCNLNLFLLLNVIVYLCAYLFFYTMCCSR